MDHRRKVCECSHLKRKVFLSIDQLYSDNQLYFKEEKGMMPNTVNKYVTCFRKLCNLAAEEGYNTNAVSLKVWKERTAKEEG